MVSSTSLITRLSLFLLAVGISSAAVAANEGPNLPQPPPLPESLKNRTLTPPPDLPDPSELYAQLEQMGDLLALPEDKLTGLRQTIEFIEKMTPEEREAMRIRLRQITEATPELKKEITAMADEFPQIDRISLTQFWYAALEDERQSVRDKLLSMNQEEKASLLDSKVTAFIARRDKVFESMKRTLEKKREEMQSSKPSAP